MSSEPSSLVDLAVNVRTLVESIGQARFDDFIEDWFREYLDALRAATEDPKVEPLLLPLPLNQHDEGSPDPPELRQRSLAERVVVLAVLHNLYVRDGVPLLAKPSPQEPVRFSVWKLLLENPFTDDDVSTLRYILDQVAAELSPAESAGASEYRPKKDIGQVFGFRSDKQLEWFLRRHPEIRTTRPLTRKDTRHPKRLNIHAGDIVQALAKDDSIDREEIAARVESSIRQLDLAERSEKSVLKAFGISKQLGR